MERRKFLTGISAVSVGGVAGCTASISPELEFQSFIVPDPVGVSIDRVDNDFIGELHNRRDRGNIRVELWFFRDQNVPSPDTPSQFDDYEGRQFEIARSRFLSADERGEIEITAQNSPPEQWVYGIMAWPASHGAVFRNTGEAGEIEVKFEFRDTRGYDLQEPSTKLESVGGGETIESVFDIVVPPQVEYEIIAEPA